MSDKPIGIFDSGLGGVSVLKEALKYLPNENFIYYGDNKNVPYGNKTTEEITQLAFNCAHFLVGKDVKVILVACNTATGAAIQKIRQQLLIPVVSMEPAIKPACETPGDGKILMLATPVTVNMCRYKQLQARMPDPDRVINVACPGLADKVETGIDDEAGYDELLQSYLADYEGLKVDGIVLGCTHYIFIRSIIERYAARHFKGNCTFFDGNRGTVAQLERVLAEHNIISMSGTGRVDFYTSGSRSKVLPIFNSLMQL